SEDRTRLLIARKHLLVDDEPAGGRLLRKMQERQEGLVALGSDVEVIEAAFARREPVGLEDGRPRRVEQLAPAPAEQDGVELLVGRMAQIEEAQRGVSRELGGAGDVVSAVLFRFGKGQELPAAALD